MKEVYLDYAAATPLDPRVKRVMEPYWEKEYGNPSSIHERGRKARAAIEGARRSVAAILGCGSDEIIFTAGATEADNLGIFGVVRSYRTKYGTRGHVAVSRIEHDAILRVAATLGQEEHGITYVDVDKYGIVVPEKLKAALRPETVLVSIGYANNEIGTVQPIRELAKVIRERKKENSHPLFFHTDASQAAGFLELDVRKLGVDLMTLNSGKIYGPKGVGCLFVRRGITLAPLIYGGGQEQGIRSGTENVPGIIGFAKALETADKERVKESARLLKLRDYFIQRLMDIIPDAMLNGHAISRLPNNVNISIPGIEGEAVVLYLDAQGIRCATGAACNSFALEPSHVITALGKAPAYTIGSLRFTLGRGTTKRDIDYTMRALREVLKTLRPAKK